MQIAILGWGSLIWQPKNLEYDKDIGWNKDGPSLPIEFARISKDGRLTLVIYKNTKKVQTLWTVSSYDNLEMAINNLKSREGTHPRFIGFLDLVNNKSYTSFPHIINNINEWAKYKNIDAVIWTDLPANFEDKDKVNKKLNKQNVIEYLKNLNSAKYEKAKKYILNTPEQINTTIRSKLENFLKNN